MKFSIDNLAQRKKFLSDNLFASLNSESEGVDPFTTGTSDIPKAFRVGECKSISNDKTEFQVLLFWRDDTRSEQKKIKVEAVRQAGKWVIDSIADK
ncbi:MAG: hypothetical protein ACT4O9_12840 [Blastocatellia bacterium]